ncbi:hypothetical protein TanjilG_11728 [Lupinus angustifolius]|uniref:Uncharacterized protein n=1 Tax=Lupinus angustifolius TaxID=3871 RepID=A0A1J7HUG2_LUPAN|nr:PREDICTED: uncharacterized protein LOC109355192 [Lupinus angustifolius]OIW06041.1 hypothetical protein TanjilG_11728 [Lupinus angustifolius]
MSISIPTLLSFKPNFPFPTSPSSSHRCQTFSSLSSPKFQPLKPQLTPNNVIGFSPKATRFSIWKRFAVNDDDAVVGLDEADKDARGRSSMPERFRYLAKEAPDNPTRWPWLVVIAVLIYAWRAVLFELSNWRNATFSIVRFIGYTMKYVFAVFYRFIGNPITFSIRCVEDLLYTIRTFYSSIINYTPVPDLTITIVLASVVLAVAEATVPDCVNNQPYVLTVSGFLGYAAVRGYISEPLFWTLLLGVYGFSKLLKKRDDVSSVMPVAAVLAAVGEPWVRVLVIISFTALAIFQHSKMLPEGKEVETAERRLPIPLLVAALAIGIRIAAKWAGYRHLTWMIV